MFPSIPLRPPNRGAVTTLGPPRHRQHARPPAEIVRCMCQGKAPMRSSNAPMLSLHQKESKVCLCQPAIDRVGHLGNRPGPATTKSTLWRHLHTQMCPWQCVQRRPCGLLTRPTRPTTRLIPTRQQGLPRLHVQRLIRHRSQSSSSARVGESLPAQSCRASRFRYHPLRHEHRHKSIHCLVVALGLLDDPALFHVSLQTASLVRKNYARKGDLLYRKLSWSTSCELEKN